MSPPAYREEPSAPPSFETEQVREFHPREIVTAPSPHPAPAPAAGYAPATPVQIEWPSDLQQVESDPEKVQAILQAQTPAPRETAAPRPRRVRPPVEPVKEEPLVQIETGLAETQASGSGEKTPA